jgi:prepilin-type N-terminal cleavage/methylation domain-containing protein
MKWRIKVCPCGKPRRQISVSIHTTNRGAFTSIELLVVIAVFAVLAAIWLPALARTKEKDFRIVCLNNEKQLYTSLHIYCDDNADNLPLLQNAGAWPWDIPTPVTTAMLKNGCIKKTFYCPSTAPRFTDQENWAAPNSLWNFGAVAGFNTVGYLFALGGNSSRIDPLYQNLTILGETHKNLPPPQIFTDDPATRELVTDVVLSTANTLPATSADNFSSVFGGFAQNGVAYPHLSAHLRTGLPSGGNINFKDGHVRWRKFDASNSTAAANTSKVRSAPSQIPYFWW